MSTVKVDVDGLPELIVALRNNAGLAKPFEQALSRIGVEQESASRRVVPVNTGHLKRMIKHEVDKSPFPTFVRIGTIGNDTVKYAAWMEYGTGEANDHPNWPKKEHKMPPPGALDKYVTQKGRYRGETGKARASRLRGVRSAAFALGKAINEAGGLKPRRYLRGPFETNRATYVRYLTDALKKASLRG
jgi:hypothetical protein